MQSTLVKLGKKQQKFDDRTLMFADYLTPSLPPIPRSYSWIPFLDWGMMKNDTVGDCTIAGVGHMIMNWTTYNFKKVVPSDDKIIQGYTAVTAIENGGQGYDPSTGANDNGCSCLDVLNYWKNTGIAGHNILGYTLLTKGQENQIKAAIMLFGGVYMGVWLPISVQDQVNNGEIWDAPAGGTTGNGAPGSWGGHLIIAVKYTAKTITFISWGQLYTMTWEFFHAYCDEYYGVVSEDFLTARHGASPVGFDLATLEADIAAINSLK